MNFLSPFIAYRYLRARKEEGLISVIAGFSLVGIALGVATLIVVMSVINGFRTELMSRLLGMEGHLSVVAPTGMDDYDVLNEYLLSADARINSALPMVEGQVVAAANDQASGAMVRGIRLADMERLPFVLSGIVAGNVDGWDEGNKVAIGERMAFRLGLTIGDDIMLVSPRARATVMGAIPRMKTYTVGAVFTVGMAEYDANLILMPLAPAQLFFQLPEKVNLIDIHTVSADAAPEIAQVLMEGMPPYIRLTTWQQSNAHFFNALKVERNVMFLILTLIILVAAFNIISSLIMLVHDKTSDIAILRTMGATRGLIMRVFMLCGASVGIMGTLLGVGMGLAIALNLSDIQAWLEGLTGAELFAAEVYFLTSLPVELKWPEVVQVAVMALILSFLATFYPAWKAARMHPVEALRYG